MLDRLGTELDQLRGELAAVRAAAGLIDVEAYPSGAHAGAPADSGE